ncbi:MAG: hypothetical protein M9959_01630 [Chitinophagaceae bacterium]|nr:hypothetical protein [Chitinophagaceae bacterium]
MKSKKSPYPKWVNEHRKPGTEIRKIGDKFYIYSVSAYYDAARGKGRKKTGPYLGRITQQDGFIEAISRKVPKTYTAVNIQNLSTRDYGLWSFYFRRVQGYHRRGQTIFSSAMGMDSCSLVLQN